ncbi:MAG: TonB-dependent receptor [Pseudomonadota bacterium]
MINVFFRHLLTSAGATALLAVGSTASAQEDETEARLSTITVTAQRVEENLQDVPISVTTLADEKLNSLKAGGADIRFLSARVPSVIAESSFGRAFPRFYIRGIGNTDFDLNATQPVSLVYDDVPYENPILKGYPVFDLAAIEVLRGPQGTLFGRNTPGGIIKFDSVKPGDDAPNYARFVAGERGLFEAEAGVGGRWSDALAVRLSGLFQTRDDFVDNGFTGEENIYEGFEEQAGRLQFLITPFDNDFSALLNIHARSNDSSARLFRANIIEQGERGLAPDFDFNTVFFDGADENNGPLRQDAFGVTLTLENSINDVLDVTYIFGLEEAEVSSRGDIDGGFGAAFLGEGNFGPGFIPFPSESGGNVDDLTQLTHELRFAFDNGGPLRGQSGVFYFNEDITITSTSFDTLAPTQPINGIATRGNDTESFGIFGSLSYDVTDQLTVSGGARWTDDSKDFAVERILGPFGAPPLGPITGNASDDQVSWDVSATYAATDAINVYGRIAKGFRGPSIQGRLVFGDNVSIADSETVLSYEAGVKTELFDNRVRANANVYFYELEDQQLTIVGGLDNTVQLFNADEGEGKGFEADVEALPFENLLITAGVSFNDTEIKDDLLIAPGCGAPCTVLDPSVFQNPDGSITQVDAGDLATFVPGDGAQFLGFNISGNSFPNAPEWIGNITARYGIPIGGGELYAFTDWAFKGETNFFLYESIEFGEDGFWEGGLRVGYASDLGFDLSVFGRNITEQERLTGGIDFNNLTGFVNEPRVIGVELRIER